MDNIGRRKFLSLFSASAAITCVPFKSVSARLYAHSKTAAAFSLEPKPIAGGLCWLDLCAPLILEDDDKGLHSEIVLTSDTFVGGSGHEDRLDATEYELHLYDSHGVPVNGSGPTAKLNVTAMQTTVIAVRDLIAPRKSFWGGLRVRLRPLTRQPMHASDLFSSAFVRWQSKESFTTVHANPDPLEWQRSDAFFYSMPFPPLKKYECVYSMFNPYAERSAGSLFIYDASGSKLRELPFDLEPHSSVLLSLSENSFQENAGILFPKVVERRDEPINQSGGTLAVVNRKNSAKNFGYLLMKPINDARFSIEHPIHQPPYDPLPPRVAFDSNGRLKAKNVLFTPFVFVNKKIGGITLNSRFHLSSGAPMEPVLWMSPFITDANGSVVWQAGENNKLPQSIPEHQVERGVIKLAAYQSCIFDCKQIDLPKGFSGGFSLAMTPTTNHTLMKVEIHVSEWNATSFTHFRPGLAAARNYQKSPARAGIATDYVVSAARMEINNGRIVRDEIIAIINIDDKSVSGYPTLEVFASTGLLARVKIGEIPAFSCRHYLLSTLLSGVKIGNHDFTLRLVDERTTLLMSIVHVDYNRRDIALDHGSDRFSTFGEFTCVAKA